ncbi:Profilin-3 [Tupaia chinensis]|uniref:Profilin-3 n=1 Tax=Tupaia chinensis TaxID=246437 RepID=L9JCA5_TUPCH|nr:Profilin-3 [Tupaia chinensis]
MGDWKGYISAVLRDQRIDDVAIVGHSDNRCVWASRPGGLLAAISPQEVGVLTGPDRNTFLQTGLSGLDGRAVCVGHDYLLAEGDGVLDARTKGLDGRAVCVGHSPRALLVLMGRRGLPVGGAAGINVACAGVQMRNRWWQGTCGRAVWLGGVAVYPHPPSLDALQGPLA